MSRNFFKYAISLLLLIAAYSFFPSGHFVKLLADVSLVSLALSLVIVFSAGIVTSYRFYVLTQQFEFALRFKSAHFINIMSQLSGLVMFQMLGQVISRAGISSLYTENPQRMVLLTFLEKAASIFSLLLIAAIGGYSVAHSLHVDLFALGPLLLILTTVLASVMVVWNGGISPSNRRYIKKAFRLILNIRIGHITLTCMLIHLLTLSGYVIIAQTFLPDTPLLLLGAAFSVVMLGAAFPISFAGWGIRELTAGFVFSALSLDPAIGVTVAALIGVISLVAIGIHSLICTLFLKGVRPPSIKPLPLGHQKLHMERLIAFISAGAIALLIGCQLPIATLTSKTTVNLADPFALLGGLTFITFWYLWHKGNAVWRVPYMNVGLSLFIILILYGWFVGFLTYGSSSWASVNRAFGLVIIFSYLASGAMFTAFFGRKSISLILRVMTVISITAFVIFWGLFEFHLIPETLRSMQSYPNQFSGLASNRNAFAFQMSMVFAVLIALPKPTKSIFSELPLAIVLFLVIASGSRTGMLSCFAIIGISLSIRLIDFRGILRVCGYIAAILAIDYIGHIIITYAFSYGQTSSWSLIDTLRAKDILLIQLRAKDILLIQADRWASYVGGIQMWRENMLIGGGLGAFITSQGDSPLVIHNTMLWVLAEMGVVGLVMWLYLPIALLAHSFRNGIKKAEWEDIALVLCLTSTFVFSLFHEIYYQRIIWFFIGLLASNRWGISPPKAKADNSAL